MLRSLANQRPRRGWSMPHVVENSDILYFTPLAEKNTYRRKNVDVYGLDGIATAIEEVGISGSRSSPSLQVLGGIARRAQRKQPVSLGVVVNNFSFNIIHTCLHNKI
jgi:hypothetical protein